MPAVVQKRQSATESDEKPWFGADKSARVVQASIRERTNLVVAAKKLKATPAETKRAQVIKQMYDEYTAGRVSMEINHNRSFRWGG